MRSLHQQCLRHTSAELSQHLVPAPWGLRRGRALNCLSCMQSPHLSSMVRHREGLYPMLSGLHASEEAYHHVGERAPRRQRQGEGLSASI